MIFQRIVVLRGVYPYAQQVRPGEWVGMCCGIGGMTSVLEVEGENTVLAIDKDETAVRVWNCIFGHGGVQGDLTDGLHNRVPVSTFLVYGACGPLC